MAVDRNGSGDIYAAEVTSKAKDWKDAARRLLDIPANYRIIGLPDGPPIGEKNLEALYAPSGIGRIGIYRIVLFPKSEIEVRVEIAPQRFKVNESYLAKLGKFTAAHAPDFEVRY